MQIRKRYISWAETTLQIRHLFFQESPALFRAESLVSWTQAGFWPHLLLSWVPKRRKQPNRGARSTFYKDSLLLFLLLLSNYVSCSGSEHSTIRDHYHLIHFYGQGVFHRPPTHLGSDSAHCRSAPSAGLPLLLASASVLLHLASSPPQHCSLTAGERTCKYTLKKGLLFSQPGWCTLWVPARTARHCQVQGICHQLGEAVKCKNMQSK